MCLASDKLKLCTCNAGKVDRQKHYWILYRHELRFFGHSVMPNLFDGSTQLQNSDFLLQRLNEPDVFDKEMELKEFDRVELVFICDEKTGTKAIHGFEYRKGRWQELKFGYAVGDINYKKHTAGIIDPAIR